MKFFSEYTNITIKIYKKKDFLNSTIQSLLFITGGDHHRYYLGDSCPKPSNGSCGIFSFLIKVYKLKPVGLQNQENFKENFDASIGSKTIIFSEVNTQQVLELKKYVI
ncbi:unnamed protein product [Rhizophagus irregularis]|nr:unnamed protein product [Rhizophagus irregularis]